MQQGAFAGTGRSQDGDAIARAQVQIDVRQNAVAVVVVKGHVLAANFTAGLAQPTGRRGRMNLDRGVQYFEHAPCAGQALLHAVQDIDHLGDLAGELLQQTGEHDQSGTQGEFADADQISAVGRAARPDSTKTETRSWA